MAGEQHRTTLSGLLDSALAARGSLSNADIMAWIEARRAALRMEVRKVPFRELTGWRFDEATGNLVHASGRFFRVEGIEVETNFGPTPRWMQPIINQPEIGILGFLTQRIGGVLHLLVQAKVEPGNVNGVQLSPTVQATRSNYMRVHGGALPRYLEYFLDRGRGRILFDQLHSEQGSRYLNKRNRNVIVELTEHEHIEPHEDFCWMTLGQLAELLKIDNVVNMDSRTVLSCVRYPAATVGDGIDAAAGFAQRVLASARAPEAAAENDFDTLIAWITWLKQHYKLKVRSVPLDVVEGWQRGEDAIHHIDARFFSVVAVAVRANSREVAQWCQPLIESAKGGIICLICQQRRGVLHFLVQGRVEPGNLDVVELAPTLQCTPANYTGRPRDELPPFFELVTDAPAGQARYSALQSEEGGRFYHDQNRYQVIEIDAGTKLDPPDNYIWMTLAQMKELMRFGGYFNIEARGLIACLAVT